MLVILAMLVWLVSRTMRRAAGAHWRGQLPYHVFLAWWSIALGAGNGLAMIFDAPHAAFHALVMLLCYLVSFVQCMVIGHVITRTDIPKAKVEP